MPASPSAAEPVTDLVAQADTMLCADRQFGDSAAIGERNLARFRLGLTMLARHDGEAADVLRTTAAAADERLRPLLYDPVLRNCFEVDLARLESGRLGHSSFGAYVSGYVPTPAADAPSSMSSMGPCEALIRPHRSAWPGLGDAWVLTEPTPHGSSQEKLAGRLMELYRGALGDSRAAAPVDPADNVRAVLREGAELLATLLPAAGAGVLGHVTMVGFTQRESEEGPLQSMSGGDPLPSTVLLAPERCTSPWLAAESLLHEGAHLKLFDALRTGSVVKNATERVPIPWRIGSWTVIRVFVALHFYVHLLVFRAAAASAGEAVRERFGPPRRSRTSTSPARAPRPPAAGNTGPVRSGPATSPSACCRCRSRRSPSTGTGSPAGSSPRSLWWTTTLRGPMTVPRRRLDGRNRGSRRRIPQEASSSGSPRWTHAPCPAWDNSS